ncbi:MAG: radical SAM protein [Nitrososphaerota archaeon]
MNRFYVDEPVSAGVFLSYRCTCECRHCMYACSPYWRDDWISKSDLKMVLSQLAGRIVGSLAGSDRVSMNYGLHFTGGEPFLNFNLLLEAVELAHELDIPSMFVETNAFWCLQDHETRNRFRELRDAGLHGVLVSVNPFTVEWVPFERTDRAIRIGREVFPNNVIIYQEVFYEEFKGLGFTKSLCFDEYLRLAGLYGVCGRMELLPIGRTVYRLTNLYRKYPARQYFGEGCRGELSRGWHIHIDNYCNCITGYCGGISLGDGRNIDSILNGIDLEERPIIGMLLKNLGSLYEFAVREYGYEEDGRGYISKCHLCLDIRRHLVNSSGGFKELEPKEFYEHL